MTIHGHMCPDPCPKCDCDGGSTMVDGTALVRELESRGWKATWEYPGYVAVGNWSFGTADGYWAGDNTADGHTENWVDLELPGNEQDIHRIADKICEALK